jgi:hypothetical protein
MNSNPPMQLELDGLFKRVHLANARRVWRDLIVRAEHEQWTYHQLLSVLVAEEIAHRQQTRLARLSRRAFPLPQDHRRLRFHLPVHRTAHAPRLRSLARFRHRRAHAHLFG